MTDSILIYIFSIESESIMLPAQLPVMRLLIPPLMTNRLPWSLGYFETVGSRKFELGERLPNHCFKEPGCEPARYWNDDEKLLIKRTEPCGFLGLYSYRTIDDAISDALGIPKAPD